MSREMQFDRTETWKRYVVTVALVILATGVSLSIQMFTEGRLPLMPFIPVIIATSIYFGGRSGLLALLLSSIIGPILLVNSGIAFPSASAFSIPIVAHMIVGLTIVWVCHHARSQKQIAQIARSLSRSQEQMTLAKAQELETVMKAVPAAIYIGHDPGC